MGGIQEFNPHILNNFYGLERMMSGKEAIAEIEVSSKNLPSSNSRYFARWQIVWITLKYPFERILSLFFKAISTIASLLDFQRPARFFYVLSRQMMRDWHQISFQWRFNSKFEVKKDGTLEEFAIASSPLLMPAFNAHQISSWDYYTQDPVPLNFLTDSRVKALTAHTDNYEHGIKQALKVFFHHVENRLEKSEKDRIREIFGEKYAHSPQEAFDFLKAEFPQDETEKGIHKFYNVLKAMEAYLEESCLEIPLFSEGLCRGACLWFIFLYFKTQEKFTDPLNHLLSVSEQFKTGVPKQAALLQSLEKSFIKMEVSSLKNHSISLYELDLDRESALEKIQSLNYGIYRIGVLKHSLVYIKVNGMGYQWDPEYGLVAVTEKQLLDLILANYYEPGNSESQVYVEQYKMPK
jgi:hypothetical protein